MSSRIYLEGGGDDKSLKTRCREGFKKLLQKQSEFEGRLPKLVACGGRGNAFDRFETAHRSGNFEFVALLIDSEDPMKDITKTWSHLKSRDNWNKPRGSNDKQVLMMTTCMETWIVSDRKTLKLHYGSNLQDSALPALSSLEGRTRGEIQDKLKHSTRNCDNRYEKNKRSFAILGKLDPTVLSRSLPSFARVIAILDEKL